MQLNRSPSYERMESSSRSYQDHYREMYQLELYQSESEQNIILEKERIQPTIIHTEEQQSREGSKRLTRSDKKKEKQKQKIENKRQKRKEEAQKRKKKKKKDTEAELVGLTLQEREERLQAQKEIRMEQHHAMLNHLNSCYEGKHHLDQCYRVCFNCSFNETMSAKERASLAKQLGYCYVGLKRNLDVQIQYHLTSYTANEDDDFHKACQQFGAMHWKVHFYTAPYWEIFPSEDIVVLSPDADEELEMFDSNKIYIIGGLVDRTIAKNETLQQAKFLDQISIKKLPLKKYLPHLTSPILNVNTVVDIMREWIRTKDWIRSLEIHIPHRKQGEIGTRGKRKRLRQERLTTVDTAQSLAIERLDELCTRYKDQTETFIINEISEDLHQALQIVGPYAERKLKSIDKKNNFEFKDEINSKDDHLLLSTSIWPSVPSTSTESIPLTHLRFWLNFLKIEKEHKYRQLHQDHWNCEKEWDNDSNQSSIHCISDMFQE